MFCTVYLLRRKGEKLPTQAIRQVPYRGEFRYQLRLIGKIPQWNVMKATLLGADGARYVVPVLDKARIVKIQGDGMLITGTEVVPTSRGVKNIKADYYRQSWYCVPEVRPFDDGPVAGWRGEAGKEWARRHLKPADE